MKKLITLTLALVLCVCMASTAMAAKYITIGTAGTAGALYPMGVAMAQTITDHVDGISATGEATAASIQNARDLHEGNTEMAIVHSEVAYYALNGMLDYTGNPFPELRALYSTIYSYEQIFVPANSDIRTVADLKGKTISVGAAGSGGEMTARALLSVNGLDYTTVNAQFMGESDGAAALKDGKIDAMICSHPLASAALTELTTSMDVRLIEIPADDKFFEEYPLFSPKTVPAGTYRGIDVDIVVPCSRVLMCTSTVADLSDDEVYQIMKAIWDYRDEWAGSAKAVENQVLLETALEEVSIPLHPGAVRFYEEIGMTVPDNLK